MTSTFRGVHHLALNTDDMMSTVDFYTNVLGMPLIHAMRVPPGVGVGPGNRGNPPFENLRHYFFDMGHDSTLAFFEIPKGATPQGNRDAIAAMQHVAFAIDEAGAEALLARLERLGVANTGAIESFPGVFSVYLMDPNGIRLEFAFQRSVADVRVLESVKQSRHEALEELRTLTDDAAWLDDATAYWTSEPATLRP